MRQRLLIAAVVAVALTVAVLVYLVLVTLGVPAPTRPARCQMAAALPAAETVTGRPPAG